MKKATILIVEDDVATADLIRLILTRSGYAVTGVVASGEKAVDTAIKTKPDLVLMDIRLKGKIDGIMAFERIKKVVNVPVVFVSAYMDKEMIARARRCEPSGYIAKPFKKEVLLSMVGSLLDWQRTNSEE